MINKLFLLLILIVYIPVFTNGQICDNVIIDYSIIFQYEEHDIDQGNDYYYSINSGVKIELTISEDNEAENLIKIPRLDLIEGENELRIFSGDVEIKLEELIYYPPDVNVAGLDDLEVVANDVYVVKGINELALSVSVRKPCDDCGAENCDVDNIKIFVNDEHQDAELNNEVLNTTIRLNAGLNYIRLEIRGKYDSDIEDIIADYEEIVIKTFKIFYIDLEMPLGLINNELLRVDKIYKLKGIPEGGYFNGLGVVSNTGLYNPAKAGDGADEITYHYILEGDTFSISKTINLKPIDNIKIVGNQQVCTNHQQLKYYVDGVSLYEVDYDWRLWQNGKELNINDGIFTVSDDGSFIRVNWVEGISSGKISVDLLIDHGIDFNIKDSILVDVNSEKVPDKSYAFFLDNEAKFLVCSDTTVNFYRWYKNNELLGDSEDPYHIINNSISTEMDSFFIETSFNGACWQKSYGCTMADVGILAYEGSLWPFGEEANNQLSNPDIIFFPNPATNTITIQTRNNLQNISAKIYNMEGKVLLSNNFLNIKGSKDIEISVLKNGQYIIELILENDQRITNKFVVSKN